MYSEETRTNWRKNVKIWAVILPSKRLNYAFYWSFKVIITVEICLTRGLHTKGIRQTIKTQIKVNKRLKFDQNWIKTWTCLQELKIQKRITSLFSFKSLKYLKVCLQMFKIQRKLRRVFLLFLFHFVFVSHYIYYWFNRSPRKHISHYP